MNLAISNARFHIVRFLLDRGANVNAADKYGVTTLMCACQSGGNLDILRLVLAACVDVDARDEDQETALHYAARYHRVDVVRELILERNASMFIMDCGGKLLSI